ncbi:MAG: SDR family oxidoreductase [Gemmatimonadales bacterium]|nr:SDR family oxidoreductase [Gemmatimonadales bacterium]
MDLGLSGKVVVVTGGAKGIGAAIVRAAAAEGMVAVVVDRDESASHALAAEMAADGHRVEVVVASLDSAEACAAVVLAVMERCGRIDALVNNAGVNDSVGLEHGTPTAFGQSLRRNLSHYYEMTHYALAALKASRGAIVNIASKVALTGQGGTSGYAAAKGAILALTREWAVELLHAGIRVNAVIPAEVMTPLYAQWLATHADPEAKRAAIEAKIPLEQRMTTAEEIAAAVVFLLSAKSGHTTGQQLHVDGGYVHLDRAIT